MSFYASKILSKPNKTSFCTTSLGWTVFPYTSCIRGCTFLSMFYKELEKDLLTCWNLKHYRKLCCKVVCCRQKQAFITVFMYQVQVNIFHLFLSFVFIVHQVVCSGISLCRPPFDSKRRSDSDQREEVPRKRFVVSQHFN